MVNSFSHGAEGFAVGNVELAHWRSPIGGLSWRRRPGSLPLFRMQPRAEAIGFIFNPMFGMSGKLAVRNLPATAAAGRDASWRYVHRNLGCHGIFSGRLSRQSRCVRRIGSQDRGPPNQARNRTIR